MGPFLHTTGLGRYQIPPPAFFVCKTLTLDVNTTSEIGYLKLHDGMEKKDTRRLRMEV